MARYLFNGQTVQDLDAAVSGDIDQVEQDVEELEESVSALQTEMAETIAAYHTPVTYTFALSASGWVDNVYTIEHEKITATNMNTLSPAVGISSAQLSSLQAANIVDNGQEIGKLYIMAMGTVPIIDIPVRLIIEA